MATDNRQIAALQALAAQAKLNGVHDLQWLSVDEAQALEPELHCVAALHSPSTGIVDSHALMLSLQGELEAAAGLVVCHAPVLGVRIGATPDEGFIVSVGGEEPMELQTRYLINSAGLQAIALAQQFEGLDPAQLPKAQFAKGNYFSLSGRAPFSRLIYPLPDEGGLGIHLALDLGGQARFGPDVEWVDTLDYQVDPARAAHFYAAIRSYWPDLPDEALQPDYAGIRPKIAPGNTGPADFMIQGPKAHGIPGLINLFGIESPGLTAALALGEQVTAQLGL